MKQYNRVRVQEVIKAAAEWVAWILLYPQNPDSYPEAISAALGDEARILPPLSPKEVDRATLWLVNFLWETVNQGNEGLDVVAKLFATDEYRRPDKALRLMGESIGVSAESLALRLPAKLQVRIMQTGEGIAQIYGQRYLQVLAPALSLAGRTLIGFQVPLSESTHTILRTLGAAWALEHGAFIDLTDQEQCRRAALVSASFAFSLVDEAWELHRPVAQGGGKADSRLYEMLNSSNMIWRPWLAWIISRRSTDFPWEATAAVRVEEGRHPRVHEERVQESRPHEKDVFGPVKPVRRIVEEECGPFADMRRHLVEYLSRFSLSRTETEPIDIRTLIRSLENEGALSRWQLVLKALGDSIGQKETQGVASFSPGVSVSTIAMLAYALTGQAGLVLLDEGTLLLPELPPEMAWVWGIPLTTLDRARRARRFLKRVGEYRIRNPYEFSFLRPDGQVSPVPILYAITPVEKAGSQFRWLASGEGMIPL